MGTTVTALVVIADRRDRPDADAAPTADDRRRRRPAPATAVAGEQLALVNVGDSRTYLFRHGRLRRVTVDHSYVQELVATGHITDDEARTHPRRNIVTRALGIDPRVRVDAWTLPLVRGDRFLLCSDGLVDEVRDDEIVGVLAAIDRPAGRPPTSWSRWPTARAAATTSPSSSSTSLEGAEPPDPDDRARPRAGVGRRRRPTARGPSTTPRPRPPSSTTSPRSSAATTGDRRRRRRDRRRRRPRPPTATDDVPAAAGATAAPASAAGASPASSAALGMLAVLVLALVIAAAWARRGYFVAFDDAERRRDLPRPDRRLPVVRSDRGSTDRRSTASALDDASIERVERELALRLPRATPSDFVAEQLDDDDHDDDDHHDHDHDDHRPRTTTADDRRAVTAPSRRRGADRRRAT